MTIIMPTTTEEAAGGATAARKEAQEAAQAKASDGDIMQVWTVPKRAATRGTYITVNEIFHGQGAVGAMSLTCGTESLELAWQGGVDIWPAATRLAEERHGFSPLCSDVEDVFVCPHLMDYVDLIVTGSPCQKASWAAWVATNGESGPPDGDHAMNQLYWRQVAPLKQRCKALVIEFPTGVLQVASATNVTPGWLHEKMMAELAADGWEAHTWRLQAWAHGSYVARRRLYSFGFAPEVTAAAKRAGIEFPERPTPLPESERRILADALVDEAIIDEFHADLFTGHDVELAELRHDGTDQRQVCRLWTGRPEPEPVSDIRLSGLPLKCYGDFPLVAIPDGRGRARIRRILPSEFIRAGMLAWSVGWGLSAEPTAEEIANLKTLGGNTWDGALTRIAVEAAAAYMRPWLIENEHKPASQARLAARFASLVNRVRLPVRRAWRRWRMIISWLSPITMRAETERVEQRWHALVREITWRLRVAKLDDALDAAAAAGGARAADDDVDMAANAEERVPMGRRGPAESGKPVLQKPGAAAGQSSSSSMLLTRGLETAISATRFGWTRCVRVDDERRPIVQRSHTGKVWGARMAAESEVRQRELHERELPELRTPPRSSMPPPPSMPAEEEQAALRAACPTRADLYKPAGALKQQDYEQRMATDAAMLQERGAKSPENPGGWRVTMKGGVDEYRIPLSEFSDEAVRIARGRTITFDDQDRPMLVRPIPVADRMQAVGGSVIIRFDKLLEWMRANGWVDYEMYWLAQWGHWDKSDARPCVVSMSPNQQAAYDNYAGTCVAHQLETDRRWTVPWEQAPYALSMHVCQTNVAPKPNGTMRLLGNPSHPEPGTLGWLVEGLPVAPNRATDWDQMPGYEWASIEEFAAAMAVLVAILATARREVAADVNFAVLVPLLVICGSRDDLTKWFRQIPLCTLDMHKQVYHWAGRYLVDQHVQMGRVSSADGAQRLSMVAKAILFQRVEARLRVLLAAATTPLWVFLARVVEQRRQTTGTKNTDLWVLDLMQDDLAWVAISMEVGTIIREMTVVVLDEYGVEVSVDKRAEDEAVIPGPQPNPVVLFIGARFDATDLDAVRVRGQDKTIARLAAVMTDEWKFDAVSGDLGVRPGARITRIVQCRTIGMMMFHGRFGRRFRRRLNSGIRLLRGGSNTHVNVSAAWLRDLKSMWVEAQSTTGVPLTVDPGWWHPGLLGCNSDASRPDARPGAAIERGFGGNAFSAYFFGEWTEVETRLLDISTLELIAAGFLLVVAHLAGVTKPQMVLRCDNESACRVANTHVAHSVAMAEALIWFENIQCHVGVEVLLHHIAGEDNVIADDLSRDRVARAIETLEKMSGVAAVHVELPARWRDISCVTDAVQRQQ